MYIGISRIIFDRKMQIKLNVFVNLLKRLGCKEYSKKIVFTLYFMLKSVLAFIGGLGLFLLLDKKYFPVGIGLIFIINIILKFIDGCVEYKNTFIFPFDKLSELSVAAETKIYRTQLLVSVIHGLFLDELWLASLVFLLAAVLLSGTSFFIIINFVVCVLASFLMGNVIAGKYTYAIVVRKITIIRLLVYSTSAALLAYAAFHITDGAIRFVRDAFLNRITSVQMLLDNALLESMFEGYGVGIMAALTRMGDKVAGAVSVFRHPAFGGIGGAIILALLLIRVQMISIHKENKSFSGKDMYAMYQKALRMMLNGGILIQSQVEEFQKYRWLFVKSFFQVAVLQYESICYIAILLAIIVNTGNPMLILQLLICMNLLAMANQASELRSTGYAYFSLSTEVAHMKLLKMSLADMDTIWKAKERVFKSFLRLPSVIILLINIGICAYMQVPPHLTMLAVGVLLLSAFVMPVIQLHMMPMVTNVEYLSETQVGESFMEEEVAGKLQEFPRIFLVVIPMMITVIMLVIGKSRSLLFIGCELVYLVVSTLVLYVYMMKIRTKGVENTVKKIH